MTMGSGIRLTARATRAQGGSQLVGHAGTTRCARAARSRARRPMPRVVVRCASTSNAPSTPMRARIGRLALVSGLVWLVSSGTANALPLPVPKVAAFQIAGMDTTMIEAAVTSAGILGPVVFVLCYGVAALLLVPASVLTISGGFLFGPALGTALVSMGSTFGAALSFLVARYFARAFVERKIQESNGKILKAVDKAIENQGSKVVFLMRLSPLFPYSLINYSLGLTKIPFVEYIVASWAGMLPGTVAYTGIGAAGKVAMDASVGSVESTSPLVVVLYAVGAVATVLVTTLIGKTASSYLNDDDGE